MGPIHTEADRIQRLALTGLFCGLIRSRKRGGVRNWILITVFVNLWAAESRLWRSAYLSSNRLNKLSVVRDSSSSQFMALPMLVTDEPGNEDRCCWC